MKIYVALEEIRLDETGVMALHQKTPQFVYQASPLDVFLGELF